MKMRKNKQSQIQMSSFQLQHGHCRCIHVSMATMYVVYTLSSVSSDNNITANIQRFFELRAIELKHNDIRSVKEKYATIAIAFIYSLLFGMHNMILHNLYSGCCSAWLESHRRSAIDGQCMCEISNSFRCVDTQHSAYISFVFAPIQCQRVKRISFDHVRQENSNIDVWYS